MPKEDFDFKKIRALTYNDYLKKILKKQTLGKANAGLIFTKFPIGAIKNKGVFVPFNKVPEAQKALDVWNEIQDTTLKNATCKVSLVKIKKKVDKATGSLMMTMTPKKELKDPQKIHLAIEHIFSKVDQVEANVVGYKEKEAKSTPATDDKVVSKKDKEEDTAKDTKIPSLSPEKRANHKKRLKTLTSFFDKLANKS